MSSNVVQRVLFRCVYLLATAAALWAIVQLYVRIDERVPFYFAVFLTYCIASYVLLPQLVRFVIMILRRNRIPRITYTDDGLPADPVNIILNGTYHDIINCFTSAGWSVADTLSIRSSIKMITSFLLNRPYPEAPFSSLYLFGRKQDVGFQMAVSKGPRKRHHIRFWAANIDPKADISNVPYWLAPHPADPTKTVTWIGAGTEDLGIGLTRLTYQISHRSDKDIDKERDFILTSLKQTGMVSKEHFIQPGDVVGGKYISDGRIIWAKVD